VSGRHHDAVYFHGMHHEPSCRVNDVWVSPVQTINEQKVRRRQVKSEVNGSPGLLKENSANPPGWPAAGSKGLLHF
jgi:hypothetical protein